MTQCCQSRYFRLWLLATATGMALVALFNVVIDPAGAFSAVHLKSLEPFRPRAENRLMKAELAHRPGWDIVLLGSSRVLGGLPADYPLFVTNRTVNLALPAAYLPELRSALRTVLDDNGRAPRLVILGLDFHMFLGGADHLADFPGTRFNSRYDRLDYYAKRLLALSTTEDSLAVLSNYARGEANGSQDRFGFITHRTRSDFAHRPVFDQSMRALAVTYRLMPYWPSNRIDVLRDIIRDCRERNIDLRLILMPVHALDLELLDAAGHGENFDDLRRALVRLLASEGLEGTVPLLDATGYSGPPTEEIPPSSVRGPSMRYFIENSHATPALGAMVLNRLFGAGSNQFGDFLTSTNIESHLARFHQDRAQYRREHPADCQWPRAILESLGGAISPRGATNLPWLPN